VFGLPGMFGMFEDDRHHKPTRWTFSGDSAGRAYSDGS
jgi:hypothetical protein